MSKRSFRLLQNALLFLTFVVLFLSFYFQYVRGYLPCPLCLMQRFCAGVLLLCGLMGITLSSLRRAKWVVLVQFFFAMAGLFFASRQLWLQSVAAPETSACLPGIEMLIRYFPWEQLLRLFLWGSNSCGEVAWYGFGLSMAAWSALYFSLMLLIYGIIFCRLLLTSIQ